MRTTLNIDDNLLTQARRSTGIKQKTRLVRMGLSLLVQQESAKRLITLGGSDRQALRAAPAGRAGEGAMNVLVDTSVWIDHLHRANSALAELLMAGQVRIHPAVLGELACGSLKHREEVLIHLKRLPRLREVDSEEVLVLIERQRLWGKGLSWVDVHLLASCLLEKSRLWTLDRKLHEAAEEMAMSYSSSVVQ